MKSVLMGLGTAFSTYSILPVPSVRWDEDSRRYALCFFPLVGAVIGALSFLWYTLCLRFSLAPGLFAAVATLLPVVISGGIHMDGLMDTADALFSHALREKKLEIMQDPHIGAFGVLFCAGHLLLSFGLWQQLYAQPELLFLVLLGYLLSRSLSALLVAILPPAKDSGLAYAFAGSAAKREVVATSCVLAALAVLCGMAFAPLWGAVAATAAIVYVLLHRRFCLWEFGGNTGDLAGFFLQNIELVLLIVAVIGGFWG